jgi:hypothetical protein
MDTVCHRNAGDTGAPAPAGEQGLDPEFARRVQNGHVLFTDTPGEGKPAT